MWCKLVFASGVLVCRGGGVEIFYCVNAVVCGWVVLFCFAVTRACTCPLWCVDRFPLVILKASPVEAMMDTALVQCCRCSPVGVCV